MPLENLIQSVTEADKSAAVQPRSGPTENLSSRLRPFAVATVILGLAFSGPLIHLVKFALNETLYSHIVLIPAVSLYLVFSDRQKLLAHVALTRRLRVFPILVGGVGLAGYWWAVHATGRLGETDYLAATTFSFLLCFVAVCDQFLGQATLRMIVFPVGFLIFMVPFPVALRTVIETFMQHSSAVTAEWFFRLSGMPVGRHRLLIQLPAFEMQVAPECSGIHSSVVLLITSFMGGYLFLRTPWKRIALALAIIPLGILRNGFRIFVIGQLCVRIGPHMIDSPIHRHGGPLFFALSLVPLFLMLILLYKSDRVAGLIKPNHPGT
ncbi:MAG TPA: archaeosortase/exosortase family protein [Verrucomicrobiae bacterium]|nr:archaeosortase/exosortase family protein [Verrucomicrobiae bacterium]